MLRVIFSLGRASLQGSVNRVGGSLTAFLLPHKDLCPEEKLPRGLRGLAPDQRLYLLKPILHENEMRFTSTKRERTEEQECIIVRSNGIHAVVIVRSVNQHFHE